MTYIKFVAIHAKAKVRTVRQTDRRNEDFSSVLESLKKCPIVFSVVPDQWTANEIES